MSEKKFKFLKKAENKMAYSKIGIYGSAGSGKTYTSAKIAIGLVKSNDLKKPIAMFDTEPAASFIIPLFKKENIDFLVYDESKAYVDLMGFYQEAQNESSVIIIDSITHVWKEIQQAYLDRINRGFAAKGWNKRIQRLEFQHWNYIKTEWQKFTDLFLSSPVHCIVCGRAGSEYEYQLNEETGKRELITTGTKMATEKEMGYEPSLLIEMIKHREGNKIVNRALIEKDRADRLNGQIIDYPDFEKLKPHFDLLNLGGQHIKSMADKTSVNIFNDEGEDGWSYEKRQRTIWLEEIQGLLVKYYPSTKKEDKEQKANIIERYFNTLSWTKVESMQSEILKQRYYDIKDYLYEKHSSIENIIIEKNEE